MKHKPAGGLVCQEDAACNKLTELALNDLTYASAVLAEAAGGCQWAIEAIKDRDVCREFQASLRLSLQVTLVAYIRLELVGPLANFCFPIHSKDVSQTNA